MDGSPLFRAHVGDSKAGPHDDVMFRLTWCASLADVVFAPSVGRVLPKN
jgi:hypothetical protein